MAGDDDKKPGEASPYDRMSLDSLKRELEQAKAQRVEAREGAKERIAETAAQSRRFPWGLLALVLVGGLLGLVGLVFVLQSSFPEAGIALPTWVYTPYDGGPPPPRPDAGPPPRPDAGPPAPAHHGTPHGHGTGTGTGTGTGGGLDLGPMGSTDDPLEGLSPAP